MQRGLDVRVEGLREFRRDLRAISKDAPKALREGFKEAAGPVVRSARGYAPVRSGRLAGSLRAGVSGISLFIRSPAGRVPYANFIYWGGTTGRGHKEGPGRGAIRLGKSEFVLDGVPIRAHNPFIHKGLADEREALLDGVGDAIEAVASSHGFR